MAKIPFPYADGDRKIPAVMSTEHPDNSFPAPFIDPPSEIVNVKDEMKEFLWVFKNLGCDEVMLDAEGKENEAYPAQRLLALDRNFFNKKRIGKDVFITFRIPNIEYKLDFRVPMLFMTILTQADLMRKEGFNERPIHELILPMTTSSSQPYRVLKEFHQFAETYHRVQSTGRGDEKCISVIPLIEESDLMLDPIPIVRDYLDRIKKDPDMGFRPSSIRVMLARSDPAMQEGLISAVLSCKSGLEELTKFSEESSIETNPIIGTGSLLNRGALRPDNIKDFFSTYPQVKTITAQSAFRFDYPEKKVKKGIEEAKSLIKKRNQPNWNLPSKKMLKKIIRIGKKEYRQRIISIAPMIKEFSSLVPSHRERFQWVGKFSYSRSVKGSNLELPRAISFTSVLYTMGLPPEFIGLKTLKQKMRSEWVHIEHAYPNLYDHLNGAGEYFDLRSIGFLQEKYPALMKIALEVKDFAEDEGIELGPRSLDTQQHRNAARNAVIYFLRNKRNKATGSLLRAAKFRQSLG